MLKSISQENCNADQASKSVGIFAKSPIIITRSIPVGPVFETALNETMFYPSPQCGPDVSPSGHVCV